MRGRSIGGGKPAVLGGFHDVRDLGWSDNQFGRGLGVCEGSNLGNAERNVR